MSKADSLSSAPLSRPPRLHIKGGSNGLASLYLAKSGTMRWLTTLLLFSIVINCHGYRIFPFKGNEEPMRALPKMVHGRIKSLALGPLGPSSIGLEDINNIDQSEQNALGEAWRMWAGRVEPRNSMKNIPMFRRLITK